MADRLFLWGEKNEMDLSNAVIANADGYRESTEISLTVQWSITVRGMRALAVIIGNEALGSGPPSKTSGPRLGSRALGALHCQRAR